MVVMVILGHPLSGSFNHAIADRVVHTLEQLQHKVHFHDLYREEFNPLLTAREIERRFSFDEQVQLHTSQLVQSDGLVIVHPDWWGQPPAILKGWVDRVFRPGIAYEFQGEDFMPKQKVSLLTGKRGLVLCTTHENDTDKELILERVWSEGVFSYSGMDDVEIHIIRDLHNTTRAQRTDWLRSVEQRLIKLFPA